MEVNIFFCSNTGSNQTKFWLQTSVHKDQRAKAWDTLESWIKKVCKSVFSTEMEPGVMEAEKPYDLQTGDWGIKMM